VFAVLLSHTGRRELADQVQRELGRVLAEEEVRQVPLVDTLRTYLEHGRRPTPTAAALGIHVNTLYQRLATLDRLLGNGWQKRALDLQVLLVLHAASGKLGG
jgi:DNA-binding PucR family transcriptional regulator